MKNKVKQKLSPPNRSKAGASLAHENRHGGLGFIPVLMFAKEMSFNGLS